MTKTLQDKTLFGFSNFGHWDLFDICFLVLVIFIIILEQLNFFNQSFV